MSRQHAVHVLVALPPATHHTPTGSPGTAGRLEPPQPYAPPRPPGTAGGRCWAAAPPAVCTLQSQLSSMGGRTRLQPLQCCCSSHCCKSTPLVRVHQWVT